MRRSLCRMRLRALAGESHGVSTRGRPNNPVKLFPGDRSKRDDHEARGGRPRRTSRLAGGANSELMGTRKRFASFVRLAMVKFSFPASHRWRYFRVTRSSSESCSCVSPRPLRSSAIRRPTSLVTLPALCRAISPATVLVCEGSKNLRPDAHYPLDPRWRLAPPYSFNFFSWRGDVKQPGRPVMALTLFVVGCGSTVNVTNVVEGSDAGQDGANVATSETSAPEAGQPEGASNVIPDAGNAIDTGAAPEASADASNLSYIVCGPCGTANCATKCMGATPYPYMCADPCAGAADVYHCRGGQEAGIPSLPPVCAGFDGGSPSPAQIEEGAGGVTYCCE